VPCLTSILGQGFFQRLDIQTSPVVLGRRAQDAQAHPEAPVRPLDHEPDQTLGRLELPLPAAFCHEEIHHLLLFGRFEPDHLHPFPQRRDDFAETILHDGADTKPLIISYGWLRGYYRETVPLRGLSTPTAGSFLTPNETFDATFGGLYTDYIIPAGHRLAFKVSSNAGGTVASNLGDTVSLFTGDGVSTVRLPIVE